MSAEKFTADDRKLVIAELEKIQQSKLNQLYQTTWNIGDEQRKLEQEQTRKKENILAQAAALDAAATANRMNAHETAAGATMQGAAMYAGSAMPTKNQSQPQQQTYQQTQQKQQQQYQQTQQTQQQSFSNQN